MLDPEARSSRRRQRRVWILNHYAATPQQAGGIRHHMLAKAVVDRGGLVTIFAAGPRPDEEADRDPRWRLAWKDVVDGVRYTWVRTTPYVGNTWRRILNMLSYAGMVILVEIGRPGPDVVVGSTVHPFASLAGWYIARRRGARFIYEVRDLWPQTMVDIGAMRPESFAARGLWALEAFLTRRADAVLTVLPGMTEYLRSRDLPTHHVHYLPNGPDLASFDADLAKPTMEPPSGLGELLADVRERRRGGETTFVYAGALGLANRLEVIIDAIRLLESRGSHRIRVVIAGDGPERSALIERAATLSSVRFIDPVPKAWIPGLLDAFDVALLHYARTPVHRYGISFNKVFDYMAASLPIVFACDALNDPVAAAGAGPTVPPDDAEALASAMAALAAAGPDERRRLGQNGRTWVAEHHDMRLLSRKFVELVEQDLQHGIGRLAGVATRVGRRGVIEMRWALGMTGA